MKIKILFLALFLLSAIYAFADDTVTITTYYPSPYGVYNETRAKRVAIGDNYINHAQYCWPGSGSCTNTIDSSADLVVEGNVGIGTTSLNSSKGTSGYLDVKDVYLRDVSKWASQFAAGGTAVYAGPAGCGGGLFSTSSCLTILCPRYGLMYGAYMYVDYLDCAGGCGATSPVTCTTTLIGYLLEP